MSRYACSKFDHRLLNRVIKENRQYDNPYQACHNAKPEQFILHEQHGDSQRWDMGK
jgi:hypothetical protein